MEIVTTPDDYDHLLDELNSKKKKQNKNRTFAIIINVLRLINKYLTYTQYRLMKYRLILLCTNKSSNTIS